MPIEAPEGLGFLGFRAARDLTPLVYYPYFWGSYCKELGIVYINIIRGAKEPGNLQNHRGVYQQCFGDHSRLGGWGGEGWRLEKKTEYIVWCLVEGFDVVRRLSKVPSLWDRFLKGCEILGHMTEPTE